MSLPKYIINLDELSHAILNLPSSIDFSGDDFKNLISDLFSQIYSLVPRTYTAGSARSVGLRRYIPALAFDFELSHRFDIDVFITGITYSQSGWKSCDQFSLFADGELILDGLFTKELGQHLHFDSSLFLPAGSILKIVHHNSSGNSKQIWFDIDYLILN